MNDFIKKRNYKRSLVCQPYFVWHSLKDKYDTTELLEDDELIQLVWEDESIDDEDRETASQKIARTFRLVDEHLMGILQKNHDVVFLKGSIDERIEATKHLLTSDKMIINPAFLYRNAVSSPFAYNAKNNEIINIKYSSKLAFKDFVDFNYDYQIISRNTKVDECILWLPVDKDNYKKGEIDLIKTNGSSVKKSGETQPEDENFIRFIGAFESGVFYVESKSKKSQTKKTNESLSQNTRVIEKQGMDDFDNTIDKIEKARLVNKHKGPTEDDITFWGVNPEWSELLIDSESYLAGFNGKVFPRGKIISEFFGSKSKPDHEFGGKVWEVLDEIQDNKQINVETDKLDAYENIQESQKVVWYDFEGFSLPFAPIDYAKPYQQIVFQVSVIVTENNIETSKQNIVIDPAKISSKDFFTIINSIYQSDVDAYVVYNKSYELTRMKEMLRILIREEDPDAKKFGIMLDEIVAKTVDLYDLFAVNSPNKLPAILLYDQKARSSIKNVEKHITANDIKLPRKITPYKELEVKNGAAAMEVAINRALGIFGDNEWKSYEENLKKYCENDVRAMIMVYDYVEYLLSKGSK